MCAISHHEEKRLLIWFQCKNFFRKINHFASRIVAASCAPVLAVARCVDTLVGAVFLFPLALLTCGTNTELNTIAIASLSLGGMVDDIIWSVRNTITPIRSNRSTPVGPNPVRTENPLHLLLEENELTRGDRFSECKNR